ncbi:MAG: Rrf2 family transcriptional regulator [Dehalococcoidia bacterium]|nr:MAG: Rrf2 family transcriptional regulator [Dehalococcoidia bacterium]
MEIALERRGDYSVRAVIDLARHYGDGRRKAREIATVMDIPVRYLPQLLAPLVHRGLLLATAGPDGGYALARNPASISVLEVIEAAEGPLESPRCVLRGGPCDWDETCPLHETWGRARDALATELKRTSFADLAAADEAIQKRPARPRKSVHLEPVERLGVRDGDTTTRPHPRSVPR